MPADGVVGTKDQSALLAALAGGAARAARPTPAGADRLPAQADGSRAPAAGGARVDAAVRGPRTAGRRSTSPFFVKPVVGRLSQNVYRIEDPADLLDLHEIDSYTTRYASIAGSGRRRSRGGARLHRRGAPLRRRGHARGLRARGPRDDDRRHRLGQVPGHAQLRALRVSVEALRASGRTSSATSPRASSPRSGSTTVSSTSSSSSPRAGPAQIIEVNGRIASQFAPLVQALHGRSTYDALFELACGEDPAWEAGLPDGVAVSYVTAGLRGRLRRGGSRPRARPSSCSSGRASPLGAGR